MFTDARLNDQYGSISKFTDPVVLPERAIVGREDMIAKLLIAMSRPELSNAILIAPPGTGKSAVVQGLAAHDTDRLYLEVDVSRLTEGGITHDSEIARQLKEMFDEAKTFVEVEQVEIVFFMDEIHQVVQMSPMAVEALKPILANSGSRDVRVIAATTNEEYRTYIQPNQPLAERFQPITLEEPNRKTTIEILKGMAERYGVAGRFVDDRVFGLIYDYTNRYIPASSQPRKSLRILDAMIGWNRVTSRPMDDRLLVDVMYDSTGIQVARRVDATAIEARLNKRVLAQEFACGVVADRLQLTVAGLNDKSKPQASFFFVGPTGVGKDVRDDTLVPVIPDDDEAPRWKRHGDLQIGDKVVTRLGTATEVLGVFRQPVHDLYRVTFADGRHLDVGGSHLWPVFTHERAELVRQGRVEPTDWEVISTEDMIRRGGGFHVPDGHGVQWPARDLGLDPYVMGALVAGASLSRLSMDLTFDVDLASRMTQRLQHTRRVPRDYMQAGVDQRWSLVQGLFDRWGVIRSGGRVVCLTPTAGLAEDVCGLLRSLGVSTTVQAPEHPGGLHEVSVTSSGGVSGRFFRAAYDYVRTDLDDDVCCAEGPSTNAVVSIEWVARESSACIYVADDEHLYQAGDFVVTHNTELAKELARILFGDAQKHLQRFDMTEFTLPSSVDSFRKNLTAAVTDYPYSVVLLDEIEKAHVDVVRLLLQTLDDGRMSDALGRQVSFLNCYFIMTSNAGAETFKNLAIYDMRDNTDKEGLDDQMAIIRRGISAEGGGSKFPDEFLGRIDEIVPFRPLSESTMHKIVTARMLAMRDMIMREHGVHVHFNDKVADYVVKDRATEDASVGGARQPLAILTREVLVEVARFINENPNEKAITVGVVGAMRHENVSSRFTHARIVVTPTSAA